MNPISIYQSSFGRIALTGQTETAVEHAHAAAHLVFSVSGPTTWMSADNRQLPLSLSTGAAIDSWVLHTAPTGPRNGSLLLFFCLRQEWFERRRAHLGLSPYFRAAPLEVDDRSRRDLDTIATHLAFSQGDSAIRPTVDSLVTRVVTGAITSMVRRQLRFDRPGLCPDRRLLRAVDLMRTNVGRRENLVHIARAAGLSRPHFFALFRERFFMTPTQFWNAVRVEASIEQMTMSDIQLADLASDLGFAEPASFSRLFRRHMGISPSAFRSALK